ncbi:MAG: IS1634 family transposase [Desulfobacteraceae bacterium]|nr:IS1634 family transposase [Desulfobacteraceae bacterium]
MTQLIYNQLDILTEEDLDKEVEGKAQYFYRRLIKKQLERTPIETERTDKKEIAEVDLNSFESVDSKEIGGEWLCCQSFEELGLAGFLSEGLGFNSNEVAISLLSLIGRMLHPASELGTARWLNENSAAFELVCPASGTVDRNRLTNATLLLYQDKDQIEDFISGKVDDIFGLEDKYFLYDLTNTHFEGSAIGCEKAKFGRNKQKRNDCRQITLGLLTDSNGLPKRSRYYPGNIGEITTFDNVLNDLEKVAKGNKPVIVMDSGIASGDNLKTALSRGFDYICVSRSGHRDLLEQVNEDELKTFINKSKEEVKTQFFDSEVFYEKDGIQHCQKERILYVETQAKRSKEIAMIGKKRQRFDTGMQNIASSLKKPRADKTTKKINQRIGRLKEKCKGIGEEYDIEMEESKGKVVTLSWKYNPDNRAERKAGKYFIRTSIQADQEQLLWKLYRILGEIESSFKVLKSDLDMRPIFHQKGENIEAHLNLAVLAYFIVSFVRHRLKQNKIHHRWAEIVRIMSTQKCNINTIVDSKNRTIVLKTCTRAQLKAAEIYSAMKYKPTPFYRKKTYLKI